MDSAAPTWDLESIVAGGPGGTEFLTRLSSARDRIDSFQGAVERLGPVDDDLEGWVAAFGELDPLIDGVGELASFAGCAAAADSRSVDARRAESAADELYRSLASIMVRLCAGLDEASPDGFEALLARPGLRQAGPWLRHLRSGAALRLDPARQALKIAMDRESLTGWGRLYDLVQGNLTATLTMNGDARSVGVAELTAMRAHADPAARKAAFEAGEEAWSSVQDVCAHTLTQITGARQQHQDRLGVDELASSLHGNRIQRATLDAMWAAADALRPTLVRYLKRKGTLLGQAPLAWWDRDAPLPAAGDSSELSWQGASETIVEAFAGFHPELSRFAERALDGRWIDAAAREGRRQGGFCTGLPVSGESRIFMTFAGTMDNALTLAHELGHAYHNEVLRGQPACRRHIVSATAETASTFAEATVRAHLFEHASSDAVRAFMLDQELQASVAFLMDIPARFGFERRLFALRRQGPLSAVKLREEMVTQQRAGHGDALGSWNPLFWCSKLHFYIPDFGFYNWPYTFGYLFSAAVHARATAVGPGFLDALKDLLTRTGWQSTEALAHETLGVDLTDPAFWIGAAQPIEGRVQAFLDLTE